MTVEMHMDSGIYAFLDDISRNLLAELQKDARIPFAELGRRVGLSASATAERVRRLEDEELFADTAWISIRGRSGTT